MCGIFAAFNAPNAAHQVAAGLHAIQHRARDYAGIATTDGTNWYREAHAGLVREVFSSEERVAHLHGPHAIGHIRYPTVTDDPDRKNIQPILSGNTALAHNGHLTNADALRAELEPEVPFKTSMDSECILRLFLRAHGTSVGQRLQHALSRVRGSYSLAMLLDDQLIAVRDPSGNRPLAIGRKGASWFVASETVALEAVEAEHIREVAEGEAVFITENGAASFRVHPPIPTPRAPCVFEQIYLSHPASTVFGRETAEFRMELGTRLAEEFRSRFSVLPDIDVVTPVPDSANDIALGVAQNLGMHLFRPALVRSHYIGRSFIAADQVLRDWLVRQKFSVIRSRVRGKSVAVVDDSLMRRTTLKRIVHLLLFMEAREVHGLIACPQVVHPCRYGIDMPTYSELAAANMSIEEIRTETNLSSLTYLPLESLRNLSGAERCFACMTGEYPLPA